jgi:phage terminase large subunit-like protein
MAPPKKATMMKMTPAQKRSRDDWKALETSRQAEYLRQKLARASDWFLWARDEQLTPDWAWTYWLILAGRGFGKTRTGAEWVRQVARSSRYVNLIGATADDARDIMIEGESGIMAVCPRRERPDYQPSKRRLVWPNGARSLIFTADEPERLRGKQHEKVWADELAAWRYAEAWEQTMMGLRLGENPQACITTTPRPTKLVRELMADEATHITRGSTYDNRQFLAPKFFQTIIKKYEGTRLGRQELNAEILDDNPGALWSRKQIDDTRVAVAPDLTRIVVAVDPSVTATDESDECGVVCAAMGADDHYYILDDVSLIASPQGWARAACKLYHDRQADRLVAEVNNGGDMVEAVIRQVDEDVSYKKVTASRGKMIRAEPIAALYEQGKVHHVGSFAKLEDQMCEYNPIESTKSPDRMDALVWALTELSSHNGAGIFSYVRAQAEAVRRGREEGTNAR